MAGMEVEFEDLRRAPLRRIGEELQKELLRQSALVVGLYRVTTSTFRRTINFDGTDESTNTSLVIRVYAVGPGSADIMRYCYLDVGTSVRYAQLSSDWQSKTRPGRLRPGAGRGRVVAIDRSRPRPGITARMFTEQIANRRRSDFDRQMNAVFRATLRKVVG